MRIKKEKRMSVFDSTYPASRDSEATQRAKSILTNILKEKFRERGFKAEVKTEVPALFYKPYHSDLGCLIRHTSYTDTAAYHFFNIEIDGQKNHKTKIKDLRDDEKAQHFLSHSGTITIRFDLEEIIGNDKMTPNAIFNKIWENLVMSYLITEIGSIEEKQALKNKEFSIALKENTLTTCKYCKHSAHMHTLTACHYTQTNKNKMRCDCKLPMFISDG